MKPILFSTPMVQAILEGQKTQTRRTLKYKKKIENAVPGFSIFTPDNKFSIRGRHECGEFGESFFKLPICKGDILWVRETFFNCKDFKDAPIFSEVKGGFVYRADTNFIGCHKWKPSIFMPKEACRIFLEVTDVRLERLQDINEDDAIAEGVRYWSDDNDPDLLDAIFKDYVTGERNLVSAYSSFRSLWLSINGEDSWDANPWVWVYDFKKIEKP